MTARRPKSSPQINPQIVLLFCSPAMRAQMIPQKRYQKELLIFPIC